jgi:hypothetical protein
MPRKSAIDLETPRFSDLPPRPLTPPAHLSEAAKAVFVRLVEDCGPDHFLPADITLLERYAAAVVLARAAEAALLTGDAGKLAVWEKATRAIAGLALRLRLGPQSRREKAKSPRELSWDERFALSVQQEQRRDDGP